MSQGLRVELAIDSPAACPVADASRATTDPITDVTRSSGGETVVEEFTAPVEDDLGTETNEEIERVYETSAEARYQFRRDPQQDCFCDAIETFDCAVSDITAEDGTLVATVHVDAAEQVRTVVEALRDAFGDVALRSLHQSDDESVADTAIVDRGKLTGRQREVLETAHELGYFRYPKGANASEVAAALDISVSTLAEHLAAAQTKVFEDLLG